MKQNLDQQIRDIYKLDERMARVWRQIKTELSPETAELFEKYETEMINQVAYLNADDAPFYLVINGKGGGEDKSKIRKEFKHLTCYCLYLS